MTSPQLIPRRELTDVDVARQRAAPAPTLGDGARVLLYTSSDCWRGAGISYIGIARALEAHGFRPHVVATNPEVAREFISEGVDVTVVPAERHEGLGLRRYLKSAGAGPLIVDRAHDLRVGTVAVAGTGLPLIFRYNHFRAAPPSDALVRISYLTTLSEVVFLSSSARKRVLSETPFMRRVPATTIHEGVDSSEFRPWSRSATEFRQTFGLGNAQFLLAVGALAPEKRYDMLFNSIRLLGAAAPPLLIFGEGSEEEHLRARAIQLGLDVRFYGRVPRRQLVGAYNASTALVHAGCVETFGLAVVEAMSCARPVIVAAGGALPEVVGADGSCGLLVAAESPWDMARAIREILTNPVAASHIGGRARERAREHFSLGAMYRAYAHLVARHTRTRPSLRPIAR